MPISDSLIIKNPKNAYFSNRNVNDVFGKLDKDGSILKSYNFRGCWPATIAEITVGYETEAIEEFEVTWAVQYWEANTTS